MTLIAVFQVKNCALVASDLMLTYIPQDQITLPVAQQKRETFISQKFRRIANGDYLAFSGRINTDEYASIHRKSLEELLRSSLIADGTVRSDTLSQIYYSSIRNAQLYVGETDEQLRIVEEGQPYASCADREHAEAVVELAGEMRSKAKKFNVFFLRQLSEAYLKYVKRVEREASTFAGYISHIVTPGKMEVCHKHIGQKLYQCKEARLSTEGLSF